MSEDTKSLIAGGILTADILEQAAKIAMDNFGKPDQIIMGGSAWVHAIKETGIMNKFKISMETLIRGKCGH